MFRYAESAAERGLRIIIAGAAAAAHLPGMIAAKTNLPVIRRSGGVARAPRLRFVALDRPDARRRAGRDDGDRQPRRTRHSTPRVSSRSAIWN